MTCLINPFTINMAVSLHSISQKFLFTIQSLINAPVKQSLIDNRYPRTNRFSRPPCLPIINDIILSPRMFNNPLMKGNTQLMPNLAIQRPGTNPQVLLYARSSKEPLANLLVQHSGLLLNLASPLLHHPKVHPTRR